MIAQFTVSIIKDPHPLKLCSAHQCQVQGRCQVRNLQKTSGCLWLWLGLAALRRRVLLRFLYVPHSAAVMAVEDLNCLNGKCLAVVQGKPRMTIISCVTGCTSHVPINAICSSVKFSCRVVGRRLGG